jgi:FlaA1/EpsC-like NDP-sugar epimerase
LQLGYHPVGFLDDDPQKQGAIIFGLRVLGGIEKLAKVLEQEKIQGLIISSPHILISENAEKARVLCRERNVWIKHLRLEFVEE